MFDLFTFVYATATANAVLNIGVWVGAVAGVIGGVILVRQFLSWNGPLGNDLGSIMRRFASYTAQTAIFIIAIACCVTFGSILGVAVLIVCWWLMLPALMGGVLGVILQPLWRHMKRKKSARANAESMADLV